MIGSFGKDREDGLGCQVLGKLGTDLSTIKRGNTIPHVGMESQG
jgi:hypothetical protein